MSNFSTRTSSVLDLTTGHHGRKHGVQYWRSGETGEEPVRIVRVGLTRHQVIKGLQIERPRNPNTVSTKSDSNGAKEWREKKSFRSRSDRNRQRQIQMLEWRLDRDEELTVEQRKQILREISQLAR